MVEEARALVEEIDEFQSPPSRSQLLKRVQTETDAWV
jgi:hypothetical protein